MPGDLPVAYVRELVELVGRWRVTPETLIDGLPITRAMLDDPAARIPIVVCGELAARARRLTNEPALAVYFGMQMRLSSHGFLGFAAMTSRTIGEAIALAVRFARTRTSVIGLAHHVEGDVASLVFEERVPLGALRETVIISLAVGLWRIAEAATGRSMPGIVEVTFPAPSWAGMQTQQVFAGRIKFGCPVDRLVFPATLLDTPMVGADPIAAKLAREQCERELAGVVDASLPHRVRAEVEAALAARRAPSLPAIAKRLHASARTLKRHLAPQTFSAIVTDVRRQRALLLLDDRALSVGDIATRLGYTELPNFTRAFRKWTGQTPAAYRANVPVLRAAAPVAPAARARARRARPRASSK